MTNYIFTLALLLLTHFNLCSCQHSLPICNHEDYATKLPTDSLDCQPLAYDTLKRSLQKTIMKLNKAAYKMGIDGDTPTGLLGEQYQLSD